MAAEQKILILDDSRTQASLVSRMFLEMRLGTIVFHSPNDFLKRAPQLDERPLAALINTRMGEKSGLSLIDPIKDLWPNLPLVMATANQAEDAPILRDAQEQGVELLLKKPFSKPGAKELLRDIASLMKTGAKRPHILVVDDNPQTQKTAEAMLNQGGYRVTTVNASFKEIKAHAADKIDFAVVEVATPKGETTLSMIETTWGEVDVIGMHNEKATVKNPRRFQHLVGKPFSKADICQAVEDAIAKRRQKLNPTVEAKPEPDYFDLDC